MAQTTVRIRPVFRDSAVRITSRRPRTNSTNSYVYAMRRPRKCAMNATLEPARKGGGVFHSTDLIFAPFGRIVGRFSSQCRRSVSERLFEAPDVSDNRRESQSFRRSRRRPFLELIKLLALALARGGSI